MNTLIDTSFDWTLALDRRFKPDPIEQTPDLPQLSQSQLHCCEIALSILKDRRCVFLCEPTGTGKSFIASRLAVAAQNQNLCSKIYIVAPAHLRSMWLSISTRFHLNATFISYQMASLNKLPKTKPNALILVDEAHYLKNPSAKRSRSLRRFFHLNYICLMTATPVSLGMNDLSALMAYCGLPDTVPFTQNELRMFALGLMPSAYAQPLNLELPDITIQHKTIPYDLPDSPILTRFFELLTHTDWPVFQPHNATSTSLISQVLLHRFMSHPAACRTTLKRLQRYYAQCLRTGAQRPVTRAEYKRLFGLEGAQLPLPFGIPNDDKLDPTALNQLRAVQSRIAEALTCLSAIPDSSKLNALVQSLKNTNQLTIIFTQYADTAHAIANALNNLEPTALLTGSQSFLGQFSIDRTFLQNLFDPDHPVPQMWRDAHLPIPRLLVATDALSTGHNLQRASAVVHFDSPWNPTILRQREGRILRKNQHANAITIFSLQLQNAPNAVSNPNARFQRTLTQRTKLQNTWEQTPLPPPNTPLLFTPTPNTPALWMLCQNTWLPIHPRFARHATISTQTSLNTALQNAQLPCAALLCLCAQFHLKLHDAQLQNKLYTLERLSLLLNLWPQLALSTTRSLNRALALPLALPTNILAYSAYTLNNNV